jgi:hypothetical protein
MKVGSSGIKAQCIMRTVQQLYWNKFPLYYIETRSTTNNSCTSINHILLHFHAVNKLTGLEWGMVIHYTIICNLSKTVSPVAGSIPSYSHSVLSGHSEAALPPLSLMFSQQPLIGIIIIKPDASTERLELNQAAVSRIHKLPLALLAVGWCLFWLCCEHKKRQIPPKMPL